MSDKLVKIKILEAKKGQVQFLEANKEYEVRPFQAEDFINKGLAVKVDAKKPTKARSSK